MGRIEQEGQTFVYRQTDGEITARFDSIKENRVLAHAGRSSYKKIFHALVFLGGCYLAFILFTYRG